MTDGEKQQRHPGGEWVYSGWNEDGSYGPIRMRYLTPEEVWERRRQRNGGLIRAGWLGYLLGHFLRFW